ncbi:MAG: IS200/IS605 family transposase [Elainellaceae cyanobacterium]
MKKTSRKYRRTAHSVGLAHVHLVWIPKRRKPVLVGDVKHRLAQILNEVATERGWLIKALEVAPDHIHVLVEHSSDVAIHEIAKAFKGRSSRILRQEFPHLLKLPSLWPRSYFYDTTGAVSTAKIQAYINDPHHDS